MRLRCIPRSSAIILLVFFTGCSDSSAPTDSTEQSVEITKPAEASPTEDASDPEAAVIELAALPDPEGNDGEYSIAQTMQLVHENRLYRKLFKVPVDPKVSERVLLLYRGLPKQTPPKGDGDGWQERATALVEAAEKVAGGDESAIPAYKKAINCNTCHGRHRD